MKHALDWEGEVNYILNRPKFESLAVEFKTQYKELTHALQAAYTKGYNARGKVDREIAENTETYSIMGGGLRIAKAISEGDVK
ncbi:MAG TPA: hypothetical protein ENH82_09970 [bacterium]|nr:hypothetical protein [bacterium]